jgi:hypothetical protein
MQTFLGFGCLILAQLWLGPAFGADPEVPP